MTVIASPSPSPDSLVVGLADRDASIWVRGKIDDPSEVAALAAMLRLPWKQVFIEEANPKVVETIEASDEKLLVRRRGFIHVLDSDPSRVELPSRSLPVHLLSGRESASSPFENQLRRMTMLDALRRSNVRQLVVVGTAEDSAPSFLSEIWATGFRTRLLVVNESPDALPRLEEWLETHGEGPTASIIQTTTEVFSNSLKEAFLFSYEDERLIVRQRDETGEINQVELTDVDSPEHPLLETYDLILDRDFSSSGADDLPEDAFNAFFRGDFGDWRAFAANLPWIRNDEAWDKLQLELKRLDSGGASENRVTYIASEAGAGGTTLARYLAFNAARSGYPTLVAKDLPFTPDALPLINFLTRARYRSDQPPSDELQSDDTEIDSSAYETPWLIVYDRVHWEFRGTELRRLLQALQRAGRAVCILVVTGTQKDFVFFDETRFKPLTELLHMLDADEAVKLGQHLNRFLRKYGKERPQWQWINFQESHAVRHIGGLATFWISLAFWLQSQFDLSDSIQDRVFHAYWNSTDTPELRKAVLQIAALSSERLPMPESLIEQGQSEWPIPLLLDDKLRELSPLGLVRISHEGQKHWALAHDILGALLINAVFYDSEARRSLGFESARDAQHLRFLILREISSKPSIGDIEQRHFGEEFATTVFKLDPDHGRASWIHLWRDVLSALDNMPAPLRNGSRVFRHHAAISRRRTAWLDGPVYNISDTDKSALLERAISDINFALNSIEATPGDEPDVNLYNSLANAYFDFARVRASQNASVDELAELKKLASDATRRAFEQSPSSPYVVETHIKSLIASAEEGGNPAPGYCIEALDIVYAAIRHDQNAMRRHALAALADRALEVLLATNTRSQRQEDSSNSPTDVLVKAWITLSMPFEGRAPEALEDVPTEVLEEVLCGLDDPSGAGNSQIDKLRYQILAVVAPLDFERQLQALELLVAADYRLTPQFRLEYALLLFQQMRTDEANREFRALRNLWRETDIFVRVPESFRWLRQPRNNQPRVVNAVAAYDHGHRAMARVREFANFDVPYRPQEFGVREHRPGTVFSAHVSLGHNGPFLRPVNAPWR